MSRLNAWIDQAIAQDKEQDKEEEEE